jgi:type II secretory pathway pseudopilin PulG
MKRKRNAGTSLVEILVVIVVFLVGILAIVQVFPPGLNLIRTTRNNTVAAQLGAAEAQRILGQSGQVASLIAPVRYDFDGTAYRILLLNRRPDDLMPETTPGLPGRIDEDGNVFVNNRSIGAWQRVSGPNIFSRVIGEARPIPAPRRTFGSGIGNDFGGLVQLTFAPAYYFQGPAGVDTTASILVYGNDMVRRFGDRAFNVPDVRRPGRSWEFFFVEAEDADENTPFVNQDQVYIPRPTNVSIGKTYRYRLAFSFYYQSGTRVVQNDIVAVADLVDQGSGAYWAVDQRYWVVSLPKLIDGGQYSEANYLGAERDSLSCQRVFEEVPLSGAYDPADPYQYKVVGNGTDPGTGLGFALGSLLFNPTGFDFRVRTVNNQRVPLEARIDYTVFDWRILRDEFRIPTWESGAARPGSALPVKLTLNNLMSLGRESVDGRTFQGMGLAAPALRALQPGQTDDALLVDAETGGVILGNLPNDPNAPGFPQNPESAWTVDKSTGVVTFRDTDQDPSNGLTVFMRFPTGDPNNPWTSPVAVPDVRNRSVRLHYMGVGEWAVQPIKAARSYRIEVYPDGSPVSPGECQVVPSDAPNFVIEDATRVYFPVSDIGQQVVIGELWTIGSAGVPVVRYDQVFQIRGPVSVRGVDVGFVDVGGALDFGQGYAVRRVRGASIKLRVMWNPTQFKLGPDQVANYNALELWLRSTRVTETEAFQVGGRN